jgi:nucleoside-diphosphate-sugar epimerase
MPSSRRLRRIAVLGAAGYIGTALSMSLGRLPVELRLLSRHICSLDHSAVASISSHAVDLTRSQTVSDALRDVDVVISLVSDFGDATSWRTTSSTSMASTTTRVVRNVIQHFEKGGSGSSPSAFLLAGSTSTAGSFDASRIDGSEIDNPRTVYDRRLLKAERILFDATSRGIVRGVVLRLPTVYGVTMRTPNHIARGFVASMVKRALAGMPLPAWHGGRVRRDFLHVDDTADAFIDAMRSSTRLCGRHWLVGTGRSMRVADLLELVSSMVYGTTGIRAPIEHVLDPVGSTSMDAANCLLDPRPFHSRSAWTSKISVEDGVRHLILRMASPSTFLDT